MMTTAVAHGQSVSQSVSRRWLAGHAIGKSVELDHDRHRLDTTGVEHDAHTRAHGPRRQVRPELGLDHTRVAVRAHHLAPDDADLAAVDLTLGAVDVGDALAEVEVDV